MIWTVVWLESAERELSTIWLDAEDRSLVAAAANAIDRALGRQPEQQGESREGGRRILLRPPLGVTFEVNPDDRLVRVLEVWRFRLPSA